MDTEAVRQLRMGPVWVLLIRGDAGWILLACRLDHIVLAGSYCIGLIVSYRLDCIRKHWLLCDGWLLAGWYGWDGCTGWDVGGTGMGCTDFSSRWNRSATIGAWNQVPPLDLEFRWAMVSVDWHQLHRWCEGAEYLCWSSKIIQIDCTQIGTNT